MTINIAFTAFDQGVADVRSAVRCLESDERAIDHRVQGLLGSGWTGVAAASFSEAWQEWRTAAAQVLEALDGMGRLLIATRHDLVAQDESSQRSLDSVSAQLIDRLS